MPAQNDLPLLIRALHEPRAYRHPVESVSLVQTHISWVLLTGAYAYKIKKPVKLHFLDFSTLALRKTACHEELRLNRRLAPELYLNVVPITGSEDAPTIGGEGAVIDYAVCMRQFPQADQLDRLLAAGHLGGDDVQAFGQRLARFHTDAAHASADDGFGTPEAVHAPLRETLDDLLAEPVAQAIHTQLAALRDWADARFDELAPVFAQRKRAGAVVEGHGDLHLANLVRLDDGVTAFDCIEFSADLRWNDGISDAAFLVMDLLLHGRRDLAYRFLNAYLEAGGDYAGVAVLRYYVVYRALVRAKIALIRAANASPEAHEREDADARTHIELAATWAEAASPILVLMHGLSGSGKTWLSSRLAPRLAAIRIRSDVERKRLHGLPAADSRASVVDAGLYTAEASHRLYAHLAEATRTMLAAGESVIVDAAFLERTRRTQFLALAHELNVPCVIVDCRAPADTLEARLDVRAASRSDASDADIRVLAHQRVHAAPLDARERALTLVVDTGGAADLDTIADALRRKAC